MTGGWTPGVPRRLRNRNVSSRNDSLVRISSLPQTIDRHTILRVARLRKMMAGQLLHETGLHPGQEQVMMRLGTLVRKARWI